MFGFSLSKVLFTVIAIAVVWYGFKLLNRPRDRGDDRVSGRAPKPVEKFQEMRECPACGTFVPAGTRCDCGGDRP